MPKESGLGNEKQNRRIFLKTAGAVAVSLAAERIVGAQEQAPLDNHVALYVDEAYDTKIHFDGKPKKIDSEIEAVILAIKDYQTTYLATNPLGSNLLYGGIQNTRIITPENEVEKKRQAIWTELKKFHPALPSFSKDNFYRTLSIEVPKYLAQYGIYAKPIIILLSRPDVSGKPVAFEKVELAFAFLQVAEVKHDKVEQWGKKISRDIVYIKGPLQIGPQSITEKIFTITAENGFLNIVIFEEALRKDFLDNSLVGIRILQSYISGRPLPKLEERDEWEVATEILMMKIARRMKNLPNFEEYKAQTLSHETAHWAQRRQGDLLKAWPHKITTNPAQEDQYMNNLRIHSEIDPSIAEIKYGTNKELAFLGCVGPSRNLPGDSPIIQKPAEWNLRHMVELVSKDPSHYGIEIPPNLRVNMSNYVLSEMDALLDQPIKFDELCDKLRAVHRQNLKEDF